MTANRPWLTSATRRSRVPRKNLDRGDGSVSQPPRKHRPSRISPGQSKDQQLRLKITTALFAAHEAGATRTRIRKATGRKADQVKTALAAGGLTTSTREQAGELDLQLTLDELALLAEFSVISTRRDGHLPEVRAAA